MTSDLFKHGASESGSYPDNGTRGVDVVERFSVPASVSEHPSINSFVFDKRQRRDTMKISVHQELGTWNMDAIDEFCTADELAGATLS